jgi:hypothetical protein
MPENHEWLKGRTGVGRRVAALPARERGLTGRGTPFIRLLTEFPREHSVNPVFPGMIRLS